MGRWSTYIKLTMRDISNKIDTLRIAIASAKITCSPSSIEAIKANSTPKKDILAIARAAGFLGVKNTSQVIPHCHPIPVEYCRVDYSLETSSIGITVEVKSIYKTGCEMEALHGASVVALTIYDMLKPIDNDVEISTIKLNDKKGGKSSYYDLIDNPVTISVLVCSDSVSAGKKEDSAGKAVISKCEALGLPVDDYTIIPDEEDRIRSTVEERSKAGYNMVILCGGTGLSPKDITTEVVNGMIDREIPGVMEAARSYGQQRTPYAMLSRGVAGMMGNMLLLAIPGSTKGAMESMDALFPHVLHIFKVSNPSYRHGK